MDKASRVEKYQKKLKQILLKNIRAGNIKKSLAAISVMAEIMYRYNQEYVDDFLEDMLLHIGNQMIQIDKKEYLHTINKKTVLFYDSFGTNMRGIAIVYTQAIALAGYRLIYVTNTGKGIHQPDLERELKDLNVEFVYIDMRKSYIEWINELKNIFLQYKPEIAFFYTTPSDVSGTVVFNALKGCVYRYLLDLTDHAFWLGKNAADLYVGGRDVSAAISHYYRGIKTEQLVKLDANLYINRSLKLGELPFNPYTQRYIFSGGSLYKTLGDSQLLYYKIVEAVLCKHSDLFFVYAGNGDDTQIRILKEKYGERIVYFPERNDFYQIMEHCTIYLNTYPMFGGLMMRYAANAGKLPITLKHRNDSDGILFNQSELKIEYDTAEDLLKDLDRLLEDKAYLTKREAMLKGAVMTQESFVKNIRMLIDDKKTEFEYHVEKIDTSDFRKEYFERFDCKKDIAKSIAKRINRPLFFYFPLIFIKHWIRKIPEKIKER